MQRRLNNSISTAALLSWLTLVKYSATFRSTSTIGRANKRAALFIRVPAKLRLRLVANSEMEMSPMVRQSSMKWRQHVLRLDSDCYLHSRIANPSIASIACPFNITFNIQSMSNSLFFIPPSFIIFNCVLYNTRCTLPTSN